MLYALFLWITELYTIYLGHLGHMKSTYAREES